MPGLPESDKIFAYTRGDCWRLAFEVEKLTGWPAVYVMKHGWYAHVVNLLPNGCILDVKGLRAPGSFAVHPEMEGGESWEQEPRFPEYDPCEDAKLLVASVLRLRRATSGTAVSRER